VALALLALANLKPVDPWDKAQVFESEKSWALATREIIKFWNENYGENVSSGSYDDVRRKDLLYLVESQIVLNHAGKPKADINDPSRRYAVNVEAKDILRKFGTPEWQTYVEIFKSKAGSLKEKLALDREQNKVPVSMPDGKVLKFSSGLHNELQKAIIEEFLPRFAPGADVLYMGDTANKNLVVNTAKLKALGFPELARDKLPDIVALDNKRNWIFLVEAVHSANPISPLRHVALESFTASLKLPKVYVSAFKDITSFSKWVKQISWETEVWLADSPSHMIHFNGDKFLGPHKH
jgi:type II restriction enzyme